MQEKEEIEEGPKCDKNNPNDLHYGEAGDYDENCKWIADIGKDK